MGQTTAPFFFLFFPATGNEFFLLGSKYSWVVLMKPDGKKFAAFAFNSRQTGTYRNRERSITFLAGSSGLCCTRLNCPRTILQSHEPFKYLLGKALSRISTFLCQFPCLPYILMSDSLPLRFVVNGILFFFRQRY